jgi:hypothetical protein
MLINILLIIELYISISIIYLVDLEGGYSILAVVLKVRYKRPSVIITLLGVIRYYRVRVIITRLLRTP